MSSQSHDKIQMFLSNDKLEGTACHRDYNCKDVTPNLILVKLRFDCMAKIAAF